MPATLRPAGLQSALDDLLAPAATAVERLWARDHALWRDDPTELADRLGWLDAPSAAVAAADGWRAIAERARADGFTHVVVVGMGGSSLFPDVLAATFPTSGPGAGCTLEVLDSTHPDAVRRVLELPAATTLFVVSSKSGTTLETRSHLDAIWASRVQALDEPGRAFVAVTDPGSELEALAGERGFRAVAHGDPEVGGRFSALTAFGLVPAALLGVDLDRLLATATAEAGRARSTDPEANAGLALGALLAAANQQGRDKVVLVLDERLAAFGDWVEQLVAESLGKEGTSVTPIVGDGTGGAPIGTGADRLHVVVGDHPAREELLAAGGPVAHLPIEDAYDLGALVVAWEVATAVAGALLDLQPFDQPDVAAAKAATQAVLAAGLSDVPTTPLDEALAVVGEGDLLALTAFVDPGGEAASQLPAVRARLQERLGVATTLGVGPRYLHSTGQLHKGGDDNVVVVQVVEEPEGDVAVPGRDEGFRTIFLAQAEGDLTALRERGRRAFRVPLAQLIGA